MCLKDQQIPFLLLWIYMFLKEQILCIKIAGKVVFILKQWVTQINKLNIKIVRKEKRNDKNSNANHWKSMEALKEELEKEYLLCSLFLGHNFI